MPGMVFGGDVIVVPIEARQNGSSTIPLVFIVVIQLRMLAGRGEQTRSGVAQGLRARFLVDGYREVATILILDQTTINQ
jgi:hypothetical protein